MVGFILFNLKLGYPSVGLERVSNAHNSLAVFGPSSASDVVFGGAGHNITRGALAQHVACANLAHLVVFSKSTARVERGLCCARADKRNQSADRYGHANVAGFETAISGGGARATVVSLIHGETDFSDFQVVAGAKLCQLG